MPQRQKNEKERKLITIADVNGGSVYLENAAGIALYGRIVRTESFDKCPTPGELLTKAQKYMGLNYKELPITFTIKAIDLHLLGATLDQFEVGHKYRVISPPHNIDTTLTCLSIDYDFINPENTSLVIGTPVQKRGVDGPTHSGYGDGSLSGAQAAIGGKDGVSAQQWKYYKESEMAAQIEVAGNRSAFEEFANGVYVDDQGVRLKAWDKIVDQNQMITEMTGLIDVKSDQIRLSVRKDVKTMADALWSTQWSEIKQKAGSIVMRVGYKPARENPNDPEPEEIIQKIAIYGNVNEYGEEPGVVIWAYKVDLLGPNGIGYALVNAGMINAESIVVQDLYAVRADFQNLTSGIAEADSLKAGGMAAGIGEFGEVYAEIISLNGSDLEGLLAKKAPITAAGHIAATSMTLTGTLGADYVYSFGAMHAEGNLITDGNLKADTITLGTADLAGLLAGKAPITAAGHIAATSMTLTGTLGADYVYSFGAMHAEGNLITDGNLKADTITLGTADLAGLLEGKAPIGHGHTTLGALTLSSLTVSGTTTLGVVGASSLSTTGAITSTGGAITGVTVAGTTLKQGGTALNDLFLGTTAKAADSNKLNGELASKYVLMTGLDNALANYSITTHTHSGYLAATGKAADSGKLNGQEASYYATAAHGHTGVYLGASAQAADSGKLNGQAASYYATAAHGHTGVYLGASAQAADSGKLGGLTPDYYSSWDHTHSGYAPMDGNGKISGTSLHLSSGISAYALDVTTVKNTGINTTGNISASATITTKDAMVTGWLQCSELWLGGAIGLLRELEVSVLTLLLVLLKKW